MSMPVFVTGIAIFPALTTQMETVNTTNLTEILYFVSSAIHTKYRLTDGGRTTHNRGAPHGSVDK